MHAETCSTPDSGYMGDPRRGASLGRSPRHTDPHTPARFHLRRVRLDSGGYDSGGAYWGHGGALFEAFTDDGREFMTLRVWREDAGESAQRSGLTPNDREWWRRDWKREAAKDSVRELYPTARFYR